MISKEDHEKRMTLYRAGLTDTEIGRRLYLSVPAVAYWRSINGLPSNLMRRKITPELDTEMWCMYQDGMSDNAIAKKVDLSANTVLNWRRRMGLPANFTRGGKKRNGRR